MLTHHVHMHPGQDPKLQAAAYAIAHTASTYTFGAASGHDMIVGFDANLDTLVFPDAPTATHWEAEGQAIAAGVKSSETVVALAGEAGVNVVRFSRACRRMDRSNVTAAP